MVAVAYSALRAFADQEGAPVQVSVYEVGTTTSVSLFVDEALTTPLANPLTVDTTGSFHFWLDDSSGTITEVDVVYSLGSGTFRVTVPVR